MPPAQVQKRVAALVNLLEEHRAILRPARPEGLHVTLRFLGDTTLDEERRAAEACAAAVAGVRAFPLVIGGVGVFPSARRPRVVWIGVRDGATNLMALQWRVEDELLRRGGIVSREHFTPHLTLARVRTDAAPNARAALAIDVARLTDIEQARLTVTGVSLVQSVLTPHGSIYMTLQTATLASHE